MCNKTLITSAKQTIGNANKMTNYNLKCINCSSCNDVSLIAHRNKDKYITGFIVVCEDCALLLDKSKKSVNMVIE